MAGRRPQPVRRIHETVGPYVMELTNSSDVLTVDRGDFLGHDVVNLGLDHRHLDSVVVQVILQLEPEEARKYAAAIIEKLDELKEK